MEENIHLEASDIEGTWRAGYSAQQEFFEPDTDRDEQATIILKEGFLSGTDPFGGIYQGHYTLVNGQFVAMVHLTSTGKEATTVFENLDFPLTINLSGEYTSPDYLSLTGNVIEQPEVKIIINCRKEKTKE